MKSFIVTGGNTGIGLATVDALASMGHQVVFTSRSKARGDAALASLARHAGRVECWPLDLADPISVDAFAARVQAERPAFDGLVLNAGLLLTERRETAQGFEEMFAVNHLGHFQLCYRLRAQLEGRAGVRVVVVSSNAHRRAPKGLDFDDLQSRRGFEGFQVYGKSKLANLYFARGLAARLAPTGVVHALHPGVVATEFASADDARGLPYLFFRLAKPFLRTPADGARTSVYLATADAPGRQTGLYYVDEKPTHPMRLAQDDRLAERLFEVSESLLGLPRWPRPAA